MANDKDNLVHMNFGKDEDPTPPPKPTGNNTKAAVAATNTKP